MELRWAREDREEEEGKMRRGGGRGGGKEEGRRKEKGGAGEGREEGRKEEEEGGGEVNKGSSAGVCHFRTAHEQCFSGGPQRTGCSQWATLIP